jgi:hypothetical protein
VAGGDALVPRVPAAVQQEVAALLRSGEAEPLGHELYREARGQGERNRSALVLGIAAAEVGFKQYVAAAAPDTAWLMANLQTPPLIAMFHHYWPLLRPPGETGAPAPPLPRDLVKTLDRGVQLRNKVVHAGRLPAEAEVREVLAAVGDFLWLLDYHRGFAWAADYLSPAVRASLAPRHTGGV